MPVSQSKLARLTPNVRILCISVPSFWLCESIVANPIIYRLGMKSGNCMQLWCHNYNGGLGRTSIFFSSAISFWSAIFFICNFFYFNCFFNPRLFSLYKRLFRLCAVDCFVVTWRRHFSSHVSQGHLDAYFVSIVLSLCFARLSFSCRRNIFQRGWSDSYLV